MAGVLPVGAIGQIATLLVGATFGALILAANPRKPAHQFLAAFLFLIAANQGAEAAHTLFEDPYATTWRQVAAVFASLDPLMLYYFASVYPERNALNKSPRVAVVFAGSAVLAATAFIGIRSAYTVEAIVYRNVLTAFTLAVYLVILLHAARARGASPDVASLRLLYAAMCFAALPLLSRLVEGVPSDLFINTVPSYDNRTLFAILLAGALAPLAALPLLLRSAAMQRGLPAQSDLVRWAPWVAALMPLLSNLPRLFLSGLRSVGGDAPDLNRISLELLAVSRWVFFSSLISMAVVRHGMLGMSLRMRQASARVLVGLAFLGLAVIALAVVQGLAGPGLAFSAVDVVVLGAALLASQRFQRLIDLVGERVYGVPMPGDLAASLEAYRAAVSEAAREGRDPEGEQLRRLQRELGLDDRAAGVLRRMVEAPEGAPLAAGQLVGGRYRVQHLLGRGGAGRAFLARDELLQREVVLKEVPGDGAGQADAPLREARLAGGLQHPNIVTIHDALERQGNWVLVTEFVGGGSLEDHLARKRFPLPQALQVLDGVLAGLEAVHAKGIVHCDLKPANVLLTADGAPKIADFGVARLRRGVTADRYEAGLFAGTPEFMAPEQRLGGLGTPRSDIYAAGLLLKACAAAPLPEEVAKVVARALSEEPLQRWPSAAAMRAALREAWTEGGIAAPTRGPAG